MAKSVKLKCAECARVSRVTLTKRFKGATVFRMMLWAIILVPKLAYGFLVKCVFHEAMALWHMSTRETVAICPNCHNPTTW